MSEKYCPYCLNPSAGDLCPVCGRNASEVQHKMHHLAPGTLLNGKYIVGAALGEGGFGITYVGRDTTLDMRIAIKEYYPAVFVTRGNSAAGISTVSVSVNGAEADFETGKVKFLSEARMLAKFSSEPNIVSVRDFFEANNTAYIVMEYLEGIDLKEYLVRNGLQTFENAYALVSPVMAALAKVHKQGLIHRDISPSNIMVLNSGVVKLLDFGAARTAGTDQELSVVLKPGFAPPEQYNRKGDQGPWTDVYALCATMYKLLTGAAPADSINRMFSNELTPASSVNPSVTPMQDAVLARGMALAEHERYASMEELMDACRSALRSPFAAAAAPRRNEERTYINTAGTGAPTGAHAPTDSHASAGAANPSGNAGTSYRAEASRQKETPDQEKTSYQQENPYRNGYSFRKETPYQKETSSQKETSYRKETPSQKETSYRKNDPPKTETPPKAAAADGTNPKKPSKGALAAAIFFGFAFLIGLINVVGQIFSTGAEGGELIPTLILTVVYGAFAVFFGRKYFPRVDDRDLKPNLGCMITTVIITVIAEIFTAFYTPYAVSAGTIPVMIAVEVFFACVIAFFGWFWYPRLEEKQKRGWKKALIITAAITLGIVLLLLWAA